MYNNQPNLTHRTSESVGLQQYSTPVPIAFNAGMYVADGVGNGDVLEPTAGNGMLVISFNTGQVYVNEIDPIRNQNLRQSDYEGISNLDAEKNDNLFGKKFDGIITNPPFGSAETKKFNDYKLNKLEHILAANALKQMNKDGRGAIIIGGHNRYDNKGRLQSDRTFFNWLYHHYNVDAVMNLSGDMYRKQGTQFPIRLILINGKKEIPQGAAPLYDEMRDAVVKDFEELYNKVKEIRNETLLRSGIDAEPRVGGITDVRSPGGKEIQKPGRTETIPEPKTGKTSERQPIKPGGAGESGSGVTKYGEPLPGKQPGVSGVDTGKPPLQGGIQPGGKGIRGVEERGSKQDLQRGFDTEPIATITRTDIESNKPNVPYKSESKGTSLETVIPRNMSYETFRQLKLLGEDVGGDIDQYVVDKLEYKDKEELYSHLGAEQIDATALAIASIEKNQGMIIGDMAGVGKGRVAASIIRYGNKNGYKPVFFTETPDLFSDLYRDMKDTGNKDLIPFIVNDTPNANITDQEGKVIYAVQNNDKKRKALNSINIGDSDYIVCTYSQVRNEESISKKRFILNLAEGNILILDESHNASGESNTSRFFKQIVQDAKGVTYLSATFAKRPNNMPVYAVKTAMSEANLSETGLIEAIEKGGVALQEIVSTDMVEAGQMIRRELSYEGIKVEYKPLTEKKTEHTKVVDSATEIIRDVINFQRDYIKPIVDIMDTQAAREGQGVGIETGTNLAGVDNTPFASKVFNVIDQLLFSLKADSAAEEAIKLLKENKKPVIAVKNTMESFLDYLGVQPGEVIENIDFSTVLERALRGLFRIRERDAEGNSTPGELSLGALTDAGRKEYKRLLDKINSTAVGITISPIDHIVYRLNKAGYKVGEVTGRKLQLKIRDDGKAIVEVRSERDKKKLFRDFNNWENPGKPRGVEGYTDMALIVNASGSTGRSAHSSPKFLDQRIRAMATAQIELNINTEIQKRNRINRTGQLVLPEYVTLSSAIPAEQRLLMMAKKKLKSLDANVSSDQSQAGTTFEANDFLNKYGDEIVIEYLKENRELNDLLLDPFKMNLMNPEELEKFTKKENAAHKTTGRVAILPTHLQEEFYKEIGLRYDDHIRYLDSIGENDLEVKILPLDAMTTNSRMLVAGKGGSSPFGRDSMLETVEVNVLKKPFRMEKVNELLENYLDGKTKIEKKKQLLDDFKIFWKGWEEEHLERKKEVMAKDLKISKESVDKHLAGGISVEDLIKIYPHLDKKEAFIESEFSKYAELVTKFIAQADYVTNNILGRFTIGEVYKVPYVRDNISPIYSNGIFLGWTVNPKRRNPYAPSAIMLKFIVADSRQMVELPGSKRDWLNDVTSETYSMSQWEKNDIMTGWDNALPDNRREAKNIVTGNILQAVGDVKGGQLISYTTKEGGLKRGILVKDAKAVVGDEARVPIKRARKFIQQLDIGDFVEDANGEVTITNDRDSVWVIEVPASKKRGGKYYLNDDMKKLVINGRFDKYGSMMRGEFKAKVLDQMIDLLQDDFGISIRLSQDQLKKLGDEDKAYQLAKGVKTYQDDFGNNIPANFSKVHEYTLDSKILSQIDKFDIEFRNPRPLYLTKEEIKAYNYTDDFIKTLPKLEKGDFSYEEGQEKYAVEATGANFYDAESGRWIISISNTATPSAYTEEIIHQIQRSLDKVSPEMARKIKEWEKDVRELAELGGISIPKGIETFAQAMVFTHLGYAEENPDVAELYEIPPDIYNEFIDLLNQSKSGKENISDLLFGTSKRGQIRLPSGKFDNSKVNFTKKRQEKAFQLKTPEDKRVTKGLELYEKLKVEQGEKADVYPEWRKQMRSEFGKEIANNERRIWNIMKGYPKNIVEYYGSPPKNNIESAMLSAYNSFNHLLPKEEEIYSSLAPANAKPLKRYTQSEAMQMALKMFLNDLEKISTAADFNKNLNYLSLSKNPELKKSYEYLKGKLNEAVKDGGKDENFLPEYRRKVIGEKIGEDVSVSKSYQLKPAPKELIEKVEAQGLVIDKNSIATYKVKGGEKEFIGISTPDKKISRITELSKLDELLQTFPPNIAYQLKKRSESLTPNQILLNTKGIFPTPVAIKEAKEILGDKFIPAYQKYREKRKPSEKFTRDIIFDEGYIIEDFARKVVAADKMGINNIETDLIQEITNRRFAMQLKKPRRKREDKFSGPKFENEIAREKGQEPETGEGNVVDFGMGLGQVFTGTADKISEFINNHNLEKELGIENDPKLKKLYREFLTSPQWFFDKEPQLRRVWDIIDRHFVRNVNEEIAILTEDKWKNGKSWRNLTDLEKKEFLSALEEYEQTQYELQRDGDDLELLDWMDFADEFALTPKVTEFLLTTYKPVVETALDMVKDVDRYKIINETKQNPYLQTYYEAKAKGIPQVRLDNELEKAKDEFFNDDPNSEALFINELATMQRNNKPTDEVRALELAWINNPEFT